MWGETMAQAIKIDKEYITLSQLLKIVGAIGTGGEAKWYLQENDVIIDGEYDNRRGRKLYPGMTISVPEEGDFIIESHEAHGDGHAAE
ncbi:MAG: RNA-binding protein [Aerococcus viridans]|nr:MAG: RNA-binding protein [Aerococcus viridans]